MHNRLRMITAMYLTKDLLLNWQWGERHFMQQLVDGDLAANNGGWQWSAGTGTDAAPYFRIFNPVTQGEKFDPDGDFVRRWVPELAAFPADTIHQPWTDPAAGQIHLPHPPRPPRRTTRTLPGHVQSGEGKGQYHYSFLNLLKLETGRIL